MFAANSASAPYWRLVVQLLIKNQKKTIRFVCFGPLSCNTYESVVAFTSYPQFVLSQVGGLIAPTKESE